jgi:hypothetical protein
MLLPSAVSDFITANLWPTLVTVKDNAPGRLDQALG